MSKGADFERKICKRLSMWWSGGKRDDLFWRTSQSGGRATIRSKKKKKTQGHYGDICATGSEGLALIHICTIELKTGYPGASILDLVDRQGIQKPKYGEFILQAMKECKQAGTPFWMLITRRFQKEIMVYIPVGLYSILCDYCNLKIVRPKVRMSFELLDKSVTIIGTTLDSFLDVEHMDRAFRKLSSACIMKL